MLQFEYPWLFALLLLPPIARRLLPRYHEHQEALRAPFFARLVSLSGDDPNENAVVMRPTLAQRALWLACWALLVSAIARPVWVGEPEVHEKSARDLLVAVDLSSSMYARDFKAESGEALTRLDAVKYVLKEFFPRREGDRIGLVFFGNAPFLQSPFTLDLSATRALLEEAQVGMAGPQTMLADAVGLGINLFEDSETKNRVMLLLTDGNDTGSVLPPNEAAAIAANRNIKLYPIAIGDPETVGESEIDVEALQAMAEVTGGHFFHAQSLAELEKVYARIDELEPAMFEQIAHHPKTPLFIWPLGVFTLLVLTYHVTQFIALINRRRREPRYA